MRISKFNLTFLFKKKITIIKQNEKMQNHSSHFYSKIKIRNLFFFIKRETIIKVKTAFRIDGGNGEMHPCRGLVTVALVVVQAGHGSAGGSGVDAAPHFDAFRRHATFRHVLVTGIFFPFLNKLW